jgi:glutathione S-transferase
MTQCSARVWNGMSRSTCSRNAKVERNGLHYCGLHDPVRVKEKNDKRNAKWQEEWNAREERIAANKAAREATEKKIAAFDELLEAVKYLLDGGDITAEGIAKCRAAIAKAES